MCRWGLIPTVMLAVALFSPAADAASSIYHSGPDNTYGWCAGYATQRASRCAEAQCRKHGGGACRHVASCNGGGAVAFSEPPVQGFGASCGFSDESARRTALIACMSASNALCRTSTTFLSNGRTLSSASNRSFDQVWFAQLILQSRRLYDGATDGTLNEATRAAIAVFQKKLGRAGTGVLDDELLQRLLDAIAGPNNFASIVKRDLWPRLQKQLADAGVTDRIYAAAVSPAPGGNFASARSEEERRLALATYLAARDTRCTLPARSVSQPVDGIWIVTCDEGTYNLILSGDGSIITGGGQTKRD